MGIAEDAARRQIKRGIMRDRENILLIRLKSIGDILFTLPAVHAVRENLPGAKIHFLVSKEYAPILRGFADVDEIIPLDRAIYQPGNFRAACAETFQLLNALRRKRFSRVIDFQGYGETELLAWWSGAPERWGSVYHRPRGWTYTQAVPHAKKIHPAEQNLSLLQQCGLRIGGIRNEFILPGDALDGARQFFAANKLDVAKLALFIQPFTSAAKKNWPLENYLKLAWHFHSLGAQIIFGGGPNERAALEPARAAGFPVAAGVPLLVSAGLAKMSAVILGADTGLLHLAVALGQRVVMLMRSNASGSSHPFQHADWAVTPAAGKNVADIQISAVIAAGERAFSERAGNVSC
jgi:ADP-heptose:LPS heptosyltransferase